MATSKTKKIETPIDERETFVSLQKSFAEDAEGVREKVRILYELQRSDNEIEKIVQLRGELPAEVAALEEEVAAMQAKIEKSQTMIAGYQESIELNKNNIVEYDAQIDEYKARLDNISNSREYDSLEKEIENLGLLRQIAVKNIGDTRVAIEERRAKIEDITRMLEIRSEDLAAKKEELEGIVSSTSGEEEKLRARRDSLASKIDKRTISAYERIRASVHNHLAVVPIFDGDSCGGCFNTITPQRLIEISSGNKLVICEHCGRIIVDPTAE